jgi:putative ABC transport system permease protein
MGAQNISWLSLGLSFLLLAIPLAIFILLKVKLVKTLVWSAVRMSVQLLLVGLFLVYIFEWNNSLLTAAWLLVMVVFAAFSVVGSTGMKYRRYTWIVFLSFLLSASLVLLYFNGLVIGLDNLLEARYAIAIIGMLLGNSLGGVIVGMGDFYKSVGRDEKRYQYRLALGATRFEALAAYLRGGIVIALKPALANMATMGLVFLPGMMTGQILSGEPPLLAVRYQIAIVIAIFVCVALTVTLSLLLTLGVSFDAYGNLKRDIFREKRRKAA